jgi:hypothetical protein
LAFSPYCVKNVEKWSIMTGVVARFYKSFTSLKEVAFFEECGRVFRTH